MHALLQFNNTDFVMLEKVRLQIPVEALHQVLMLHLAQHFVLQNY